MNILLLASAYNGMCQRMHRELAVDDHRVSVELSADEAQIQLSVDAFQPDLIICPFLKHRVPASIWRDYLCLILHPGIEGDRGPSSLDWAIANTRAAWGATLLQAEEEMDAGPIWATRNFAMRHAAKASIYRREVIGIAVEMVRELLAAIAEGLDVRPRPLDYTDPQVKGCLMPLMRQHDRGIDWQRDSAADIARKIHAADGFPGVLDEIDGTPVYLYGARVENLKHKARPGDLLGYRDGAICRATRDGAVWIRQLKLAPRDGQTFFKLPALQVLTQQLPFREKYADLTWLESRVQRDIHIEIDKGVAYVTFDFYNGAMNTEQCLALQASLRALALDEEVRVIALLGGEDFWSNGIHLNCIEAAADPALESWRNINAIDDVVHTLLHLDNKLTVAALRNNAGAGGAIVPLACDLVIAREGVVLNPHYQTMGLYGSEYWTYLLPRRVGQARAQQLTRACLPVLAGEALEMGMVDRVFAEDWEAYHQSLHAACEALTEKTTFAEHLAYKRAQREADEALQPLEAYRQAELRLMKACFDDPSSDYHRLRHQFVHKISCGRTPERLIYQHAVQESSAQLA